MNCQMFESVITELARGQLLGVEIKNEALAHRDECEQCTLSLRNQEKLTRGLRMLATEVNSWPIPGLESRLILEFRQQYVPPISSNRQVNPRYWLTVVAAVLLVVFGVVAVRWTTRTIIPNVAVYSTPVPQDNQQWSAKKSPTPVISEPGVGSLQPERKKLQAKARPKKVKRNEPVIAANHANKEIATEFLSLGYLNTANLQDGGQIVRVELPRSALANFGFPVNMERYNEKVKADVLLGVDGLAHAIRFVQ